MSGESVTIELVNEASPEVTPIEEKIVLVGRIALPEKVKEIYYVVKGSDQLVIDYLADFESTPVAVD
jgi:hypothetical protein